MMTPEKILLESLSTEEQQELRFQEQKIDLHLYREFNGKSWVIYYPGKRKYLTAKVLACLISMYRIGGWTVNLNATEHWPLSLNFRVLDPNLPLHDIEGVREKPDEAHVQRVFMQRLEKGH